jgi:isopentenyl-diphosphate delta-isomerase
VHYRADNRPRGGTWGEHEIDYVLAIQGDVDVAANDNEVLGYSYASQEDVRRLVGEYGGPRILLRQPGGRAEISG